jgi:hypothetical protein
MVVSGRSVLRSQPGLRLIQSVAFLTALGTLTAGIVVRSPRRDPLVVALASVAVGISATARWLEVRRFPKSVRSGRD